MRMLAAFLVVTWSLAATAAAQEASPYLRLDDPVMPFVEHLIRSGVIADPDPLTRPLRRRAVADALGRADTTRVPPSVRTTIRRLLEQLRPRGAPPYYRADMYIGAAAGTQARHEPLRPAGPAYLGHVAGIHMSGAFGPVAISSHPYTDRGLSVDPDYTGDKTTRPPGRISDAYISLQARYGELFFGAMRRNWGPTGIDGFLTSGYAYSYDHIFLRVGTNAVRVEALGTQLDDLRDTSGITFKRYWASTRVLFHPWHWLTASIDNATLWYGPNRGFELRFLNPLKLSFITTRDDALPDSQNSIIAGAARIALPRGVVLQGSVLVDAISSGFLSGGCCDPFPSRLGATGVVDVPLGAGLAARAWSTAVTAFAYRAPSGIQNSIMLRSVGLGRNFADYVEAGVGASLIPCPMLTLSPEIVFLEQGQGDFRLPTPPLPVAGPTLFEGVVERTWRFGISGRAELVRHLDVDLNAGVHLVGNDDHRTGVSASRFVGVVRVLYRFGGPVHLD